MNDRVHVDIKPHIHLRWDTTYFFTCPPISNSFSMVKTLFIIIEEKSRMVHGVFLKFISLLISKECLLLQTKLYHF